MAKDADTGALLSKEMPSAADYHVAFTGVAVSRQRPGASAQDAESTQPLSLSCSFPRHARDCRATIDDIRHDRRLRPNACHIIVTPHGDDMT